MIRLQGKEFLEMKPYLRMYCYQVSSNGNIKAIMKYKKGLGKSSKIKFYHWLSDEEAKRFTQSKYYMTNEPWSDEKLYKKYYKRLNRMKNIGDNVGV